MLTLRDCIGLCDLTEEEVEAIAEHERIPEIVAAELGHYLLHTGEGAPAISRMIVDDIRAAETRGDRRHVIKLKLVLKHFIETHPEHRRRA